MKSLLFIPISIFLMGNIANNNNLSVKALTNNDVSKRFNHAKPKNFSLDSFTVTNRSIISKEPITLNFISVDYAPDWTFSMISKDENGDKLDSWSYYRKAKGAVNFYKNVYFPNTAQYNGYVTFTLSYSCPKLGYGGTIAQFGLNINDAVEMVDYKAEYYYSVKAYPNSGYSISSGERFELKNFPQLIEIPLYLKFSLEEYKPILKCTLINDAFLNGEIIMHFYLEDKEEEKDPTYLFYNNRWNYLSFNALNKEEVEIFNNTTFYIDANNAPYEKNGEGRIESKDFHFAFDKYEKYKEIDAKISFYDWGRTAANFYMPFKIRFLNPYVNHDFKVVGEIDDEVEDGELEEINI